jgi:hypothetical protein
MTESFVEWKCYQKNLETPLSFHIQWDIVNDFLVIPVMSNNNDTHGQQVNSGFP